MADRKRDLSSRVFAYGDIDTRGATGDDRLRIIDTEERAALSQAKSNGTNSIRSAHVRHQDELIRYKRIVDGREAKAAANGPRIAYAEAWRALGVQERYPHAHMGNFARTAILVGLAGLDFYVFAQAYAVVDDVADFSVQWWLGGLLGLVVFAAGFVFAHQLKTSIVGRAQLRMINEFLSEEPPVKLTYVVGERTQPLRETRISGLALTVAGCIFAAFVGVAIWIRVEAGSGDLSAVIMTGLVPLVIVAVEIILHDPLHRHALRPNRKERLAERRTRNARMQVETVAAGYWSFILKTRAAYDQQRQIALVKAADLGIETEKPTDANDNDEWRIELDEIINNTTPAHRYQDDILNRESKRNSSAGANL